MNAYFGAFARAFDYSGRSTRSEYWLFQLGWVIVALVVFFIVRWVEPRLVVGRVSVSSWSSLLHRRRGRARRALLCARHVMSCVASGAGYDAGS